MCMSSASPGLDMLDVSLQCTFLVATCVVSVVGRDIIRIISLHGKQTPARFFSVQRPSKRLPEISIVVVPQVAGQGGIRETFVEQQQ